MQQRILKIIALVIAIAAAGYYLAHHEVAKSPESQISNPQASVPGVKTFVSDKLGISFKYVVDQDGDGKADISAQEIGDKAYVYYANGPAEQGQWVQEFPKSSADTLQQAIEKQFLQPYSKADCFVSEITGNDKPRNEANFVFAVIGYPAATDPLQPFWQNADKCPQDYSATNGISYFMEDLNHPDKFFFFSIGQYAILAKGTLGQNDVETWQDTFQVTK